MLQKHIVPRAVCYNFPLLRNNPLGIPTFVRPVYCCQGSTSVILLGQTLFKTTLTWHIFWKKITKSFWLRVRNLSPIYSKLAMLINIVFAKQLPPPRLLIKTNLRQTVIRYKYRWRLKWQQVQQFTTTTTYQLGSIWWRIRYNVNFIIQYAPNTRHLLFSPRLTVVFTQSIEARLKSRMKM